MYYFMLAQRFTMKLNGTMCTRHFSVGLLEVRLRILCCARYMFQNREGKKKALDCMFDGGPFKIHVVPFLAAGFLAIRENLTLCTFSLTRFRSVQWTNGRVSPWDGGWETKKRNKDLKCPQTSILNDPSKYVTVLWVTQMTWHKSSELLLETCCLNWIV